MATTAARVSVQIFIVAPLVVRGVHPSWGAGPPAESGFSAVSTRYLPADRRRRRRGGSATSGTSSARRSRGCRMLVCPLWAADDEHRAGSRVHEPGRDAAGEEPARGAAPVRADDDQLC